MGTLIAMTALSVLSLNMFLPALPAMQAEFGVSEAVMGLAISGYMAAAAVLQLGLGPLSDRVGRRPVVLGLFAIFTAASLAGLLAQSIVVFLAARLVQAVAVGGGVLAQAAVRDMHDGPEAAARIATIASAMAIAPMLAPPLGGLLAGVAGWRAIYAAYTLGGVAVLIVVWRDLGETLRPRGSMAPDKIRSLMSERRFWAYSLCVSFGVGAFFIFLTGAPFVAAGRYGLPTEAIGIGLGSITGGFMTGAAVSARLVRRLGPWQITLAGRGSAMFGTILGLVLFSVPDMPGWALFAATIWVGFGNGLTLPNMNAGAISVRPRLAGTAAGVTGALSLVIGSGLTAMTTAVLSRTTAPRVLLTLMLLSVLVSLAAALMARRWERPAVVSPA